MKLSGFNLSRFKSARATPIAPITVAVVALVVLIEVAALAQGFLGAALHFDVIEFGLRLHHPVAGGGLDAALFAGGRQAGGQLVFHRNHVEAVALPFLLLPTGSADAQFFQQARAQLLELVFGALVHNDAIRATAHHLFHGQFPGAEHPFAQQGHA